MGHLVRRLTKSRWAETDTPEAFLDLQTSDGQLSFFGVPTATSVEEIESVVAALSATRQNLQNFDYLVLDEAVVAQTGAVLEQSPGETPDSAVNSSHWNAKFTRSQLVSLASAIEVAPQAIQRRPWKKVGELIAKRISDGRLDVTALASSLVRDLRERKFVPVGAGISTDVIELEKAISEVATIEASYWEHRSLLEPRCDSNQFLRRVRSSLKSLPEQGEVRLKDSRVHGWREWLTCYADLLQDLLATPLATSDQPRIDALRERVTGLLASLADSTTDDHASWVRVKVDAFLKRLGL